MQRRWAWQGRELSQVGAGPKGVSCPPCTGQLAGPIWTQYHQPERIHTNIYKDKERMQYLKSFMHDCLWELAIHISPHQPNRNMKMCLFELHECYIFVQLNLTI